MYRRSTRLWIAAGLSVLAPGLFATVEAAADGQARFVPGDVIVRFTDASDFGARVARAMRAPSLPAEIEAAAARLSTELGVPLIAVRVTSGRELVLSVERDRLMQALARRVERDADVKAVARVEEPRTVLPPARIALAVELRGDSEAGRAVRAAARASRATTPEVEALVAKLTGDLEPRPSAHISDRGQLILTIDVAALTRNLVERLERRADVEYAQVSHVVRPFPDGPSY
jgi:hypothetical protein